MSNQTDDNKLRDLYEVIVDVNGCCKYFGEDIEEAKKNYFGLLDVGINIRHNGIVLYRVAEDETEIDYANWEVLKPNQ